MATEQASNWSESDHAKEKKEVLGKVENKLESSGKAKELPELILSLSEYRYPKDPRQQQKKEAFDKALTDVAGICANDKELKKYQIKKEDIQSWCQIPLMETSDPWPKIADHGLYSVNTPQITARESVESVIALRKGLDFLGIGPELLGNCEMNVYKREPDSFTDGLMGLPKPEKGKESYLVFLTFNLGVSKIKIRYDSSIPTAAFIDGLVAVPGVRPYIDYGLVSLGPDKKITDFSGRPSFDLSKGRNLDKYLQLIQLANK
jgi:hypothetical protein